MSRKLALTALTAICLSGCGKPLGEYRFENARVVPGDALTRIDPRGALAPSDSYLIRIEFSSNTDLESLKPGDLYVHGDFCPFRERYALRIMGPYYTDRPRYIFTAEEAAVDGVKAVPSTASEDGSYSYYPNRHPKRDPRTGRYIYTAYLSPYDTRQDHRDLCLQVDSAGYSITESRSKRFVIPAAAIAAAIAASTAKPAAQ